jgi:hypothetical protein
LQCIIILQVDFREQKWQIETCEKEKESSKEVRALSAAAVTKHGLS